MRRRGDTATAWQGDAMASPPSDDAAALMVRGLRRGGKPKCSVVVLRLLGNRRDSAEVQLSPG